MTDSRRFCGAILFSILITATGCETSSNRSQAATGSRLKTVVDGRDVPPILSHHVTALNAGPKMIVHFVNVGQGECILLEFPCGAMLVDTGGESSEHVDRLIAYLDGFFARRMDLRHTLNAVLCTHPHIDHTRGLRRVIENRNFTVLRYIDDSIAPDDEGGRGPRWVRENLASGTIHLKLREVRDEEIAVVPGLSGLTDNDIDSFSCALCDPQIRILSGGRTHNPGWSETDFKNENNQSLVVRVDFGRSSMLITGDLEEKGIAALLERYEGTSMLDVDLYAVGHHGSHNATTAELVSTMSPCIAVISMGNYAEGTMHPSGWNAFRYGHPRMATLTLLEDAIISTRAIPTSVMVCDAWNKSPPHGIFHLHKVEKAIYGTGWDGNIDIVCTLAGRMTVQTSKQ